MDLHVLAAVSVIWSVAAITPGPNFFITVHTAIGTNRKLSLFTVLGIVVGTLVWSVSGYFGISVLFKAAPMLYFSLKILGGLYLVYVGFSLMIKKKNQTEMNVGKCYSVLSCFRLGLLTNLLNPKTAAFMTSLFAATIPSNASIELGVACVILVCSISAIWYAAVSVIFSFDIAKRLYDLQRQKIEKVAGAIFVGFGIKLAMSD
ncbi:LysE family translocator [Desulfopila aestuarii]|uniref:Threonine/homoserine/homoserine lactone efflux protein n=1 Tax=Desulfopila aestuarii DSM 18488 TaxID=1121416 RepID=A0A1M7YE12_9BACT|nr:LysE family transporter [Desulfopila aestuarii]SHO50831.1 Threonine/homoserine/homoserine lactone efflux protein [Desulfopila aestuarii DSM 18488]